ncbi:MAG: tRNA uridine-5-carboxymethylaminomethyl(34) synthesis enzyme MnmG [Candidatus Marinimicrobia bacterium]|nr:tRNA uridine-5-carboxymethylaminomethyl(34) synthesis enzyme MnmG [Candidatus Neomarinimicrobiota bacterium]
MPKNNSFDVIVVGGGHAGLEAALACSRMGGSNVALISLDKRAIGRMSCNPAIGGLAKGHLVREIDALGGEMGRAADITGIQFKTLNKSKGRAVWSPRAQIDKKEYERYIQQLVSFSNVMVIEAEVVKVLVKNYTFYGVILRGGEKLFSRAAILTCGTFLNGLIHIGRRKIRAGRMGEEASAGLTESLISLGFTSGRLKTGTPPRLNRDSINQESLKKIFGDIKPTPFSFRTKNFTPPNEPCFLATTNEETHEIIRSSLHESPIYSGEIKGIGPRYCPSIEDKVVRFSDKPSHQLFLEPEWMGAEQIYTNGFSTSLPENIQLKALRSVKGLERVKFIRPGYAIEYDFFPPSQLKASLETKAVKGLFFSGQINGTSGYEEAAAQGLMAGINAFLFTKGKPPIILRRDQAYIGVLIDDLVTKDTSEPYRMFTCRAEHRLVLRHTNADRRLSEIGNSIGLIDDLDYKKTVKKLRVIDKMVSFFNSTNLTPDEINEFLIMKGQSPINEPTTISKILSRPTIYIKDLYNFLPKNAFYSDHQNIDDVMYEVETTIKYKGYIQRQQSRLEFLSRNESTGIPNDFDYTAAVGLSSESKEKLSLIRPETLGQASRISGVSPSDVALLSVLLTAF